MKLYSLTFYGHIDGGLLFRQPNTNYIHIINPNNVVKHMKTGYNYDVEFSLHSDFKVTYATLISIELSNTQI